VDVDHFLITQRFEEEVNSLLRGDHERQPSKKGTHPCKGSIFKFFLVKDSSKKQDVS
jgi:hypothetical protein